MSSLDTKTNSCPSCRHELPTDNPEYEELRSRKVSQWEILCYQKSSKNLPYLLVKCFNSCHLE